MRLLEPFDLDAPLEAEPAFALLADVDRDFGFEAVDRFVPVLFELEDRLFGLVLV